MKKQIPNCAICKWLFFVLQSSDNEGGAFCKAQGYNGTYKVYNNSYCKKLFEVIDDNNK